MYVYVRIAEVAVRSSQNPCCGANTPHSTDHLPTPYRLNPPAACDPLISFLTNSNAFLPPSSPRISCNSFASSPTNSCNPSTRLITLFNLNPCTPGMARSISTALAFSIVGLPSSGAPDDPLRTAVTSSGSSWFSLRSARILTVSCGDEDQMMRSLGKWRASRTSLDWR